MPRSRTSGYANMSGTVINGHPACLLLNGKRRKEFANLRPFFCSSSLSSFKGIIVEVGFGAKLGTLVDFPNVFSAIHWPVALPNCCALQTARGLLLLPCHHMS